ncbi:MAG: PaaI family thioesterase [Elusimicrobia bacterium]|nr:PaaI family thioesterase [Elusimicrobiota bacterium]
MAKYPGPDWLAVQPFPFAEARKMFTGPTFVEGLVSLKYYKRPDGSLAAVARFGPLSEGAPGQIHGGMILTVLDEALGGAAWLAGHPVLTVHLETEFRASIPVNAELLVETKIEAVRHRVVFVDGALIGPDDKTYAAARGRFLILDAAAQKRILGK